MYSVRHSLAACLVFALAACGGDESTPIAPPPPPPPPPAASVPATLAVVGRSPVISDRYTAEVWVHGSVAYTTTWGSSRPQPGNTIYIWDVSAAAPRLADSVLVAGASTIGDVQATDDGKLLVVCTEFNPGSIVVYDLADPLKPRLLSRFTSPNITRGVHTVEVQRVAGKLYAFLAVNRGQAHASRLLIVDLSDPANPTEVLSRDMGIPFIHDVFVRDGILFTALWEAGMTIWDIGGGNRGGSVANPVQLGNIRTVGGQVHNIWWYRDGVTGSKRYAFVGQEGPGEIGSGAVGDIHVVDVTDFAAPVEVAYFRVNGAGAHNFSVDEGRGILYAAFYNAGVQALNVRGELGACPDAARESDGRCNMEKAGRLVGRGLVALTPGAYVWGVHFTGSHVYASDMLTGLYKLNALTQ